MKQRSLARNRFRRLGWLRFLLQLASVALAYVLASIPPILLLGETNAGVLGSVVASMVAALLVARLWLASDGNLRVAWSLRPPPHMGRMLGLAALGTGIIIALFGLGAIAIDALGLPLHVRADLARGPHVRRHRRPAPCFIRALSRSYDHIWSVLLVRPPLVGWASAQVTGLKVSFTNF